MIMKYLVIQSKRMYEWMKEYIEDFVLERGRGFLEMVLVFVIEWTNIMNNSIIKANLKAYIEDFVLENGISFLEIVLVFYYGVIKNYE